MYDAHRRLIVVGSAS